MKYFLLVACLAFSAPSAWSSHHGETPSQQREEGDGAALVVKNFKAADGKFIELGAFFREILGDTRAFKGCIKVDVFADDTSKTYTLIEEWESFAAYDSYMKWRTEQADVRARDLLDGVKTYEWGTKTDI